jgi:FkbM family methyltransferase
MSMNPHASPVEHQLATLSAGLDDVEAGRFVEAARKAIAIHKSPFAGRALALYVVAMIGQRSPEAVREAMGAMHVLRSGSSDAPTPLLERAIEHAGRGEHDRASAASQEVVRVMKLIVDAEQHHQAGRRVEAKAQIEAMMQSGSADVARAAAIFAVAHEYYTLNEQCMRALQEVLEVQPRDAIGQHVLASVAWQLGQLEVAIAHAEALVSLAGPGPHQSKHLGMYLLTAGQYAQALTAFEQAESLSPATHRHVFSCWTKLARKMHSGDTVATAVLANTRARFHLRCFNNLSLESDCTHAMGNFTEPEELTICRDFVPQGAVIVEVGPLVGNHTIFFAMTRKPSRIIAFDADHRCVEELRVNLELNGIKASGVSVDLHHAAVGASAGNVSFPSLGVVPMVALDDVVHERIDFLKIDVDGGEAGVLQGMERLVRASRPRIMIECDQMNQPILDQWMQDHAYQATHVCNHGSYKNYFLVPGSTSLGAGSVSGERDRP